MKRSKFVRLSLTTAVAVALGGCEPQEKQYTIDKTLNFESVQKCTEAKIPVDVCSDAFMTAMAEHRRIAPTYKTQSDCEADFVEGYCHVDSTGNYVPQLGGFTLAASGHVSQSQLDAVRGGSGTGSSGINDIMMGMLVGNMLSSNGGRYYSEPVYRYRGDRGSFNTSTLSSRIAKGSTFSTSNQVKNGSSYASGASSSGTSLTTKNTISTKPIQTKPAVAQTVTRGGFGKASSARSGWGGGKSGG